MGLPPEPADGFISLTDGLTSPEPSGGFTSAADALTSPTGSEEAGEDARDLLDASIGRVSLTGLRPGWCFVTQGSVKAVVSDNVKELMTAWNRSMPLTGWDHVVISAWPVNDGCDMSSSSWVRVSVPTSAPTDLSEVAFSCLVDWLLDTEAMTEGDVESMSMPQTHKCFVEEHGVPGLLGLPGVVANAVPASDAAPYFSDDAASNADALPDSSAAPGSVCVNSDTTHAVPAIVTDAVPVPDVAGDIAMPGNDRKRLHT